MPLPLKEESHWPPRDSVLKRSPVARVQCGYLAVPTQLPESLLLPEFIEIKIDDVGMRLPFHVSLQERRVTFNEIRRIIDNDFSLLSKADVINNYISIRDELLANSDFEDEQKSEVKVLANYLPQFHLQYTRTRPR